MQSTFKTNFRKLMLLALVSLLIGAASATVYVFYYGNTTLGVQTPDVQLLAGADSSMCNMSPCTHVSIAPTHDSAMITMTFFPAAITNSVIPASYYTNVTAIKNTGSSFHIIRGVQISGISDPSKALGKITVYYCTDETEFTAMGSLVSPANCVGNYTFTSAISGSISGSFPVSIDPSAFQYVELVAYASSSATAGSVVSFNMAIQWS